MGCLLMCVVNHNTNWLTLTTGVVKEAWPLRKELDTDRLRPRAGSASWRPAGGGRGEKDEDEEDDEEGEVWEA